LKKDFRELDLFSPSLHTLSGQTGSGKTGTGFAIAERLHKHTGKHIYVVLKESDRPVEEYHLPDYIHSLKDASNPPQDSILIGDDWQRVAPARRAMADINVVLDELMGIMRHDDIDYILDVQTYASLDRNSIIRTDYRWYKTPYMDEVSFARPEIRQETQQASDALQGLGKDAAYLVSKNREQYEGLVTGIKLPPYWSDELSRMHRRLTEKEVEKRKPFLERLRIL